MSLSENVKKIQGLSDAEAAQRLQRAGYNELPSSKPKPVLRIIAEVVKEPMFILLVACATLYISLGDLGEGFMLLASVIIIISITFYQEKKAERALDALRDLSSPRALVIRNGQENRIAGREVVVDDIVILQEGDRVPADAIVLDSLNLKIDESLLTGESVSVRKSNWDGKSQFVFPSGEDSAFVYSGTMIVRGYGAARVVATGSTTQMGRIGKSLQGVKDEPTLLQKETRRIVKTFSVLGLGTCVLIILVYGITRGDWLSGILSGLSLAMALLPEEFAVVLTIFMAMGAWRMSQKNVLTRRPASIETLGSVTVLCADKTGTLTHNKMTVEKLFANGRSCRVSETNQEELEENFHALVEYSILASQRNPFDPMERAILKLGNIKLGRSEHLHDDWELVREYPLSSQLMAMSHVLKAPGKNEYVIAAKGSPEGVADLCHFDDDALGELKKNVTAFASEGLRVLGVARAIFQRTSLPEEQHDFKFEFIGLVAMDDPLRETIAEDLRSCYDAGIRVIMITGDYPVTAQNIAGRMGLKNLGQVITGTQLSEMNVLELRDKIRTANIFARVLPEHKLMIVNALKENGEIVAMTGDGVNDAPALKSAHIGIAMGQFGTDVAREASSLVLLDDNFSSIISAIRMGRRIYDNMQKAMAYIFSVHIPIAGLTLIPVFFPGIPIILFPLHIAFLELIIDPASSLIFEGEEEEKGIMNRLPRKASAPVFGIKKILISSFQGLMVLIISFAVLFIAQWMHRPENEVRALTFTTLVIANLGLILINRSWTRNILEILKQKNSAVKWVLAGAVLFLSIVLYVPAMRSIFHFDFLHLNDLLICLSAGVASIVWFEGAKFFKKKMIS
jgi:Ca2+-transporting ATPase